MSSNDSGTTISGWVWTNQLVQINIWLAAAPTIAAILAALVVLGLAFRLHLNRDTRLRRQSFLMLLSVLAMSVPYSAAYILEVFLTGPSPWCTVAVFVDVLTGNFIQFVVSLISVNLQLVFVHGVRTEGFLKWYLAGPFLLAIVISLPPTVKGVWGWDPLLDFCYVALVDPKQRFMWQIAAVYFWSLLSVSVTLVSTLIIIGALIGHSVHRRRVLSITQRTHNNVFNGTAVAIAWRIVLYPLILIISTTISAASDFSTDKSTGISSWSDFVLVCFFSFFYGFQPLLYALVAIFVDPSFSGAVRQLIKSDISSASRSFVSICRASTGSSAGSSTEQDEPQPTTIRSGREPSLPAVAFDLPQRSNHSHINTKADHTASPVVPSRSREHGSIWSTVRTASEEEYDQM
ncbi:hypothetical protein JAAARDRAFT_204057 [Jaapia argillacea MUCL 33604]|uniref:G-protein coupled receptors family 1 profile domain-containing protein n=1 Tax=Jaapia argillacea MUCL 33604 TaxID=933084 RepID=A0A067QG32_9AGAM|nr:hypothetical protein JAAARDRAFT_204057 [Jaapia argillacea MUCL 33604]